MKKLLLLLASAGAAFGQTQVVGQLLDSTGTPANCLLTITKSSVQGTAPTTIKFVSIGGDLSGTTSGYGTSLGAGGIQRYAPLALISGYYNPVLVECSGQQGQQRYSWTVPSAASVPIQQLILGTAVKGDAGTIAIGTVTQTPAGTQPSVQNAGTPQSATLNFTFPAPAAPVNGTNGQAGQNGVSPTVTLGNYTSLPPGATPYLTNTGVAPNVVINLGVPRGADGQPGQAGQNGQSPVLSIGTVTYAPSGTIPSATITGTALAPVLNLIVPRGDVGPKGADSVTPGPVGPQGNSITGPAGQAATVTVGTVTQVAYGSPPQVVNVGTPQNAILNFYLPVGQPGATGPASTVPGPPGAAGQTITITNTLTAGSGASGTVTSGTPTWATITGSWASHGSNPITASWATLTVQ